MEDDKKYCYVMDFSDASLSEIEITEEDKDLTYFGLLNLLDKYGFNHDECSFMITTNRITNINKIKEK